VFKELYAHRETTNDVRPTQGGERASLANTSGKYKYRWMYKVSIHESAAFVIGRRGLGLNEKLSFYKLDTKRVKEAVLGTLAEKYRNKRVHSWVLWKALNDNVEAILTGLRVRLADLKEFAGTIRYKSENLLGEIFLQELLVGSEV